MNNRKIDNPDQSFTIGWLADLDSLVKDPNLLWKAKDLYGVNLVWLESSLYHTAGVHLTEEVWARSPFLDWPKRPGLARHQAIRRLPQGAYPVLPGILGGVDDRPLKFVLSTAAEVGMRVWGHMGLWSYGGMIYPELAMRDLFDREIPAEEDKWGACFCPSKVSLNQWLADCLVDSLNNYTFHGVELDHARYPPPASLPNLLACACPDCSQQAANWGYDIQLLAAQIKSNIIHFKSLPPGKLMDMLRSSGKLIEAMEKLLGSPAVSDWFRLRARFISSGINEIIAKARPATSPGFQIGVDVMPPSVALFGGHNYADLTSLDFFTGGFGLIGWENVGLSTCFEWARYLKQNWPSLETRSLLIELYRLSGFEELELPNQITDLRNVSQSVKIILQVRELENLAKERQSTTPFYPPISLSSIGVQGFERVMETIKANGMDGLVLAGFEHLSSEEKIRLADILHA